MKSNTSTSRSTTPNSNANVSKNINSFKKRSNTMKLLTRQDSNGSNIGENDESAINMQSLNTNEDVTLRRERERKEFLKKKLEERCTTLKFIFLDGTRNEVILYEKPQTYSDLQRELARLYPGTRKVLVVQDRSKNFVLSDNFQPSPLFVIKEFSTPNIPALIPLVSLRWEFESSSGKVYHGAPIGWENIYEKKKKLLKEKELEEEEKRKKSEELSNRSMSTDKINTTSGQSTDDAAIGGGGGTITESQQNIGSAKKTNTTSINNSQSSQRKLISSRSSRRNF